MLQNPMLIGFLGALVVIAALQRKYPLLGAAFSLAWCLAMGAWGYWSMQQGATMQFFGVPSSKPVFLAGIGAFALYNIVRIIQIQKKNG